MHTGTLEAARDLIWGRMRTWRDFRLHSMHTTVRRHCMHWRCGGYSTLCQCQRAWHRVYTCWTQWIDDLAIWVCRQVGVWAAVEHCCGGCVASYREV